MNDSRRDAPNDPSPPADWLTPRLRARSIPPREDDTFLEALDLLPHGVGFFDLSGMLLCANRVLTDAAGGAAQGGRLLHEILRFAWELGERVRREMPASWTSKSVPAEALATRDVGSAEGRYRLRGSRVDVDLFGLGPSVLITVDLPEALPVPEEALRLRFGLTRAEARVAGLLAEGRSNKGIAAELGISPHTARHHTQRVLQKLGVRSRAEVGQRLRS